MPRSMAPYLAATTVLLLTLTLALARAQGTITNLRFPCGPRGCAEAWCWRYTGKWSLLNYPEYEPMYLNTTPTPARCMRGSLTSGWTRALRRKSTRSDKIGFNRTWKEYETGFGMPGNQWLGLKQLHRLTTRTGHVLRTIILDYHGVSHVYNYNNFWVDSADNKYVL